jgi:hypothetical protein
MSKKYKNIMKKKFNYPDPDDSDIIGKLYNKREFYYNKIGVKPNLNNFNELEEYRENMCNKKVQGIYSHQALLSNFINPKTPYNGLLMFHGTGTGKTCGAVSIAENFKDMVKKYNTKIYILTAGPLVKENWKNEIINRCTNGIYLRQNTSLDNKVSSKKNAISQVLQYYKFLSYRSFYRKVLGEKIYDKTIIANNKPKKIYKKDTEGKYERDISIDRIYNLDNCILICDEAHNLTGSNKPYNWYGESVKYIKKKSKNLRIILLSATPMKNLALDILPLINLLRPINDPILKDKIFTNTDRNYEIQFKEGGKEYFKKMCKGYISYLRGDDPTTMAIRNEKGTVPKNLIFTKLIQCKMHPFQETAYLKTVAYAKEKKIDALDRKSEAVANMAIPSLSSNKKDIGFLSGREGINKIKNQIRDDYDILNKLIGKKFKIKNSSHLLKLSDNSKNISGDILKFDNLQIFSTKFYEVLKNVNQLFHNKKGTRTAFIYSNLVKVGIELFSEILLVNGYLEFQEDIKKYNITNDTIDYKYGIKYKDYIKKYSKESFYPATFILVTGKSSDDILDMQQEDKLQVIINTFNNLNNKNGKYIKLVLGSRVMNEGISLTNIKEVHLLDVYFNLNRTDQVIGRAIRNCSHFNLMDKNNVFPKVDVYKYAVTLNNKNMSSEEIMYKKAELKYLLVKKVERLLKEVSIDCGLNRNGNIFNEELKKYKNCEKGKNTCPQICDFMDCNFKCDSKLLNLKYYDSKNNKYKNIDKDKLDYTTFDYSLSKNEINNAKKKIKELYHINYVYKLDQILDYVKKSYYGEKEDLFDEHFVYIALNDMIPITESDFNVFSDVIIDKFNRDGYLIYINGYYIYQPFMYNEDVPMHYRSKYSNKIYNNLSIKDYLENSNLLGNIKTFTETSKEIKGKNDSYYKFNIEYYNKRKEFKYVGIIDVESDKKKYNSSNIKDIFKIREKRNTSNDKKRGTGIPSLTGAVCFSSKSKEYLVGIAKSINLKINGKIKREILCDQIKERLLILEKYSIDSKKKTYAIIPTNHKKYKFPYNLEDRMEYILNNIKMNANTKINSNKKIEKFKEGEFKNNPKKIIILINNNKELLKIKNKLVNLGGILVKGKWEFNID